MSFRTITLHCVILKYQEACVSWATSNHEKNIVYEKDKPSKSIYKLSTASAGKRMYLSTDCHYAWLPIEHYKSICIFLELLLSSHMGKNKWGLHIFTSTLKNCCPWKTVTFTLETGPSIPNLVPFFCGQAPLKKQWLLQEACWICRAAPAVPQATGCESSSSPKLPLTCTVIQFYQRICAGMHQNSFGWTNNWFPSHGRSLNGQDMTVSRAKHFKATLGLCDCWITLHHSENLIQEYWHEVYNFFSEAKVKPQFK